MTDQEFIRRIALCTGCPYTAEAAFVHAMGGRVLPEQLRRFMSNKDWEVYLHRLLDNEVIERLKSTEPIDKEKRLLLLLEGAWQWGAGRRKFPDEVQLPLAASGNPVPSTPQEVPDRSSNRIEIKTSSLDPIRGSRSNLLTELSGYILEKLALPKMKSLRTELMAERQTRTAQFFWRLNSDKPQRAREIIGWIADQGHDPGRCLNTAMQREFGL